PRSGTAVPIDPKGGKSFCHPHAQQRVGVWARRRTPAARAGRRGGAPRRPDAGAAPAAGGRCGLYGRRRDELEVVRPDGRMRARPRWREAGAAFAAEGVTRREAQPGGRRRARLAAPSTRTGRHSRAPAADHQKTRKRKMYVLIFFIPVYEYEPNLMGIFKSENLLESYVWNRGCLRS
ncbi:unnamed protein product, partial [Urochloa humidicola]